MYYDNNLSVPRPAPEFRELIVFIQGGQHFFFNIRKAQVHLFLIVFRNRHEIFITVILPNISMDDKFRLLNPREEWVESKQHSFCASFPQLLYSSSRAPFF